MTIQALAHVCLKTTDLDRTLHFYCETLGMTKAFDFLRRDEVIGCYLRLSPSSFVEVFLVDQMEATTTNHALSHFCLQTDSIEKLHVRLLEKGYSPLSITRGRDQSWQLWVTDPNGLELEFQEYTAQSSQLTGANVEVNW